MKISKEDFDQMKAKYDKEIKKGKPAKSKKGDVTDQTNWIFFDRETLERVLAQADPDPKKGGIKFYFTEYTEEIAEKYHPGQGNEYEGLMTLVFEASSTDKLALEGESDLENIGRLCPPTCEI
ncbi:MAG: molecular chaperone DnaK [Cyclobacteriaceae bacterium]|nr:molecular chaperone DnaK [Cyclobacteriaceae bacterium]MDX5466662.1 molecular chaperone DnaK [Cyclobacteriaceae bacterium]